MRLDKFLLKSTELNREQVLEQIVMAQVYVNGEPVTEPGCQVHENNHVELAGQRLVARPSRYLMLHKPANMVCSNVDETYPSVFNLLDIDRPFDLHIAGRLDADTTGLVLATDDGRWSFNIITPHKQCEKVYRVRLRDPLAAEVAMRFTQGIQLQGEQGLTRPARLEWISAKEVLLTITEGKYHQVKRMFAAVGNRVVQLHRQQVGDICLDVEPGQWRYLSAAEVAVFK